MKIVIDIHEKDYQAIKSGYLPFGAIASAIANGIPLDKIRERISLEKLGYPPSANYYKAIMKCLQIIDKYTEGSESE